MADELPPGEWSDWAGGVDTWIRTVTPVLQALVRVAGETPTRDVNGSPQSLDYLARGGPPLPGWVRAQVPELRIPASTVTVTGTFTLPLSSDASVEPLLVYTFAGDGHAFTLFASDPLDAPDIPVGGLQVGADETVSFQVNSDGPRWQRVNDQQ